MKISDHLRNELDNHSTQIKFFEVGAHGEELLEYGKPEDYKEGDILLVQTGSFGLKVEYDQAYLIEATKPELGLDQESETLINFVNEFKRKLTSKEIGLVIDSCLVISRDAPYYAVEIREEGRYNLLEMDKNYHEILNRQQSLTFEQLPPAVQERVKKE